jgi:hypothetical protein
MRSHDFYVKFHNKPILFTFNTLKLFTITEYKTNENVTRRATQEVNMAAVINPPKSSQAAIETKE